MIQFVVLLHLLSHSTTAQKAPLALFLFNRTHSSGGPAALHHVCFESSGTELLSTAFFGYRNPLYSEQYHSSDPSACQPVTDRTAPFVLRSRDIIIVPEAWQNNIGVKEDFLDNARAMGARGVTYVLSIANPWQSHTLQQLTINGWIPIAHSHYTQEYFGIPWDPLIPALEPFVYTESQVLHVLPKENMIICDDDARIVVMVPKFVHHHQVHVVQLSGFTKPQVMNLYRRVSYF